MKKNYIKPVSKTVITEMVLNTMDATAPNEKIGYGGEDNEGLDPGARERYNRCRAMDCKMEAGSYFEEK